MMPGNDPVATVPLASTGPSSVALTSQAFDWEQTVISQYANTPVILAMLGNWLSCIDPSADLNRFVANIWDISTAFGYGLDVWGRIVGVNRVLQIPTDQLYFGFEQDDQSEGFNVEPFYSGAILTQNYALSDDAYRTLIYAKALANITDGSVAGANAILMLLFRNHGNCYMRDNLDMTITWVFGAPLSPVENSIVRQSGVLPKPLGVSATVETP